MTRTRVLSIRFTEEEYKALQALSLITGKAVNAIVREAVNEKADRSATDETILALAAEARRKVEEANTAIRDRVLTGSTPLVDA